MPDTAHIKHKKPGAIARLFSCLAAALILANPIAASAQSAAIESLGAQPCSDLLQAREADQTLYAAFGVWIGGYLTAANAYEPDTFDLTPWQPIELATAQIAAACSRQDSAKIASVTASYVKHLKANKLATPDSLIRVRSGKNGLFIYKSVLADIRTRLEAQGANITDPEDSYGQSFGQALLAYQRNNRLQTSGLPDTQTLIHLFK